MIGLEQATMSGKEKIEIGQFVADISSLPHPRNLRRSLAAFSPSHFLAIHKRDKSITFVSILDEHLSFKVLTFEKKRNLAKYTRCDAKAPSSAEANRGFSAEKMLGHRWYDTNADEGKHWIEPQTVMSSTFSPARQVMIRRPIYSLLAIRRAENSE